MDAGLVELCYRTSRLLVTLESVLTGEGYSQGLLRVPLNSAPLAPGWRICHEFGIG